MHSDDQYRGQQEVPSAVTPPLPDDPPPPQVPVPASLDHLAEAKTILAQSLVRDTMSGQGWDMERLAAAQVHALVALTEAVCAATDRRGKSALASILGGYLPTDFGPKPPPLDPSQPSGHTYTSTNPPADRL